jgi:hypothetical protein
MEGWHGAKLYLAIALPLALAFAFVTPPFQSPDEVGHYWHATAIARGDLLPRKFDGRPSAMIPRDARDLVATLWMELAGKDVPYDRAKLSEAWRLRAGDELVRVSFPSFYTPVPYLPQALAIACGRVMHARPLLVFYAGRVLNAAAAVLLVMLAMRLLPDAAWVFGTVGLTPMFLYLAGSFSADAVTNGLAFCTVAAAIRGATALPVVATLLSLVKPGYALLAFVSVRRRASVAIAVIGVAAGAWFASSVARDAYYPMRSDVVTDATAQAGHVMRAPLHFARIATVDYARHGLQYLDHLVGRLGWLDVGLPRVILVAFVLLFAYATLSVNVTLRAVDRAVIAAVFVATLLIVSLSQYLLWTPVGSEAVEGMQGRYLLPAAPLVLLALSAPRLRGRWWVPASIGAGANVIAIYTLARHYYH